VMTAERVIKHIKIMAFCARASVNVLRLIAKAPITSVGIVHAPQFELPGMQSPNGRQLS
jgi:hypothetical protein